MHASAEFYNYSKSSKPSQAIKLASFSVLNLVQAQPSVSSGSKNGFLAVADPSNKGRKYKLSKKYLSLVLIRRAIRFGEF